VTEILLDAPQPGVRSTYRKVRDRGAFDFALAGAAIAVALAGGNVRFARVVLSGVRQCLEERGSREGSGGPASRCRHD